MTTITIENIEYSNISKLGIFVDNRSLFSEMNGMVEVLVIYYSRGGRTETLAQAIVDGANSVENTTAVKKGVHYVTVDDFLRCDAIVFGSPNYFSYMAGLMKDFFDKALSVREQVAEKPAAAFTSGGGSSNSALLSLERMITSFRLHKIVDGIVSSGIPSSADLILGKQMGEALARAAIERAALPTE